jgi:hypothetical protein
LSDVGATLAVYTTIYPGVEAYLGEWFRSLCEQTDRDFQLWIGLDELEKESIQNLLGPDLKANWIIVPPGATPAEIRQLSLARIVETSSEVVLVDSDDLLHPTRVEAARSALQSSELAGCALQLADQHGNDLDSVFNLSPLLHPEDIFPRNNIFGFSNSAFRCKLLRQILPIPASSVLVDWFLATRAWLLGAKLDFDREPRMVYRRHPGNTALIQLPFSPRQVRSATALVCHHFRLLLAEPLQEFIPDRYVELKRVAGDVEEFNQQIIANPTKLESYVEAFNVIAPPQIWWSCVAYPELSHFWRQ